MNLQACLAVGIRTLLSILENQRAQKNSATDPFTVSTGVFLCARLSVEKRCTRLKRFPSDSVDVVILTASYVAHAGSRNYHDSARIIEVPLT